MLGEQLRNFMAAGGREQALGDWETLHYGAPGASHAALAEKQIAAGTAEGAARNKSSETTAAMGVLPYVQQQIPVPGPIGPKGERTTTMGPNPLFEQILQRGGFAPSAPPTSGSGIPPEAAQAVMQQGKGGSAPTPQRPTPAPSVPAAAPVGPANTERSNATEGQRVNRFLDLIAPPKLGQPGVQAPGRFLDKIIPYFAPKASPQEQKASEQFVPNMPTPEQVIPQLQSYLTPETQQNPEMITRLIQALMQQYMA
jgi:hypothetical protein